MKSFFSRLNGDIQASSSKPSKESSYKFWIPSNTNAERSPPKPIPVHPDVAASHGEKRSRPLKSTSTHPPKIPLHDLPTAPLETQPIHTNDMARYTTRPNPGSSSTPYSQNHPPPSSRTSRPHEHNDTRYQVPSREAHGPAHPTGTHTFREVSSKPHRGGRHESAAPIPREIWLPSTTPAVSRQGTSEKPEQYRESGDDRDQAKELERRGKDRDRDGREREREGKGRTREREREERERSRAKERHEKEREMARAKREQDRNLEIDRGKDRDRYAEKDRREQERDSDREGEKGKNRTKERSKKENSNLTRGMERTWDSDVPYDGDRTKQDERKARRRDKTMGVVGKDDNRESHKERDRWLEKEPERARERLGAQIKYRAETTDGEQFAGRVKTPASGERRKYSGVASDSHTGHSRRLLRKTSNTLPNHPRAEEGESSDSSTRPNRAQQILTKRHRGEEGGLPSKIIHSRQGVPPEPLTSTKSSVVKATIVTVSDDLPVPPTPQHMPIYLPPKESNVIDSGLPPTIVPLNVVSAREGEALPRRETVTRLKSNEPLPHAAENVSKTREVDISIVRRPPSRGSAQPQNSLSSYPVIAPSVKGARESVHIHRPKYSQPPPTIVHDKLQTPGSSLLPELPHTSTQAESFQEPNRSLERLHSRPKKELLDLVPTVTYKVQQRIPPQSAGAEPSRQPTVSTPQNVTPLASTDPAPPNLDRELHRKVTHSLVQQGSIMQIPAETDPSYSLQLHNRVPTVMSGNSLAHEAHLRMGTPVALGKPEPMNPPSSTTMQRLQSAPLNANVIQDSDIGSTAVVSKTNEIEAATQPKNEVALSSIKSIERSQLYTELSINRPSTAMDYKSSLGKGLVVRPYVTSPASVSQDTDTSKVYSLPEWRNNNNVISPNTLSNQEGIHVATASGIAVDQKVSPSKSIQSRSNGQESIGIAITRPSTTTGFRQSTAGKSLRHHNITLSPSEQNNVGASIRRPSTATAIKQSSSGPPFRQTFNATSHILNPLVEESHSNIFPGPSTPRHKTTLNPQPVTPPITEKGSVLFAQPYNMAPHAGLSSSTEHAIVLPGDVTRQQDAPVSHRQGHTVGAADLNVNSPPENVASQASTMLNSKPDNLRNATTTLAVSIPTSNDNLHSASISHRQDSWEASDHVPIAQNSHQAFKHSVVPQRAILASLSHESTGNNITSTTLNAKASSAQPIIFSSSFTAPQIQIQRPSTSHQASKDNSIVPRRATLASTNSDNTENNNIPITLNANGSSAQPVTLPPSFTTTQIQIQRPPTSHQASKENSVVPQRTTLASTNNDSTGNNIIPSILNANASSPQPVTLPPSFTTTQIQIQRPPTSHQASKENSVVPQRTTLASTNNDSTGNNIIPSTLNANASSPQPITLSSNSTAPQIQIQRPPTSHQASKENSVVPQRTTLASTNNDSTGNNIIPSTLNANAPSPQPITLSSNSTAPQIQIQRPPTSHQASKENSVAPQRTTVTVASTNNDSTGNNIIPTTLSAKVLSTQPITLPSSFIAPQIQIQRPPTSHQASKENSVVFQHTTLASTNDDSTGNNIIPTTGNAKAPSTQPITPLSSFNAPQIQIQRPPTSHQAFKENSVVPQHATLASVNNESTGNNIISTSLNAEGSRTQSTLPSSFTHIQRPPTSISTRNNSVLSTLPRAVVVPQIQIHHLITTTGSGNNKSESPHTDFHADASIPRIPGVGADLDMKPLATANANLLPIQVDQPQDFLGRNKLHRPVHLVPTSMADVINEGTLPSHAEDISRIVSSQGVKMQTVKNHSANLSSRQPDPASSANQTRHDSVQNVTLNMQMHNDLAQGSPSLGFFNNTFSEVLHSPVVRRSGQGHQPAMKVDGKIVSAVFETKKDDTIDQTISMKTSESLMNRDNVRSVLLKEQHEVPSVERVNTQKGSHTEIHNSKAAFSQIPSEVNRSLKFPSPPSQPRIQHAGLAEILSSPFNNDQPPSSSAAHHHPSTAFSKSRSSPKLQGSLDKQRPDDTLVSPKLSPPRQSPSDLRHKEVEQHLHESPKRQLQQTQTTTARSAHLENLLSDPHGGDSLGLTPSNVPSSSSHPSIVLHPPHTTSTVPDGITRPFLESVPHINNKKPGQPGPSQVEESASRKIRPASIVDSKPLGNSIPHYRAATPLRESTSTTRHQHSMSLPAHLVPSANVPPADGPLRSATHSSLYHPSTSQTKPGYARPPDLQTLAPNTTHATSDSEETILMTPSSLARSVMLKPTVSRQSVTPSMSSQTARKGTGLFTMFRSKTPAQPPSQYEIWRPNTSSKNADSDVAPSNTVPSSFTQKKTSAPTPVPVTSVPTAIEHSSQKSKIFTPFRYLTTKRNRAVSMVSVEAQDGTAPSTIVGSPTTSMLSQAPFQPPPVRDPMRATEEWRNKEDESHSNGKLRRPGVVFDVAEECPEDGRRQRPKRTRTRHKSSSKPRA